MSLLSDLIFLFNKNSYLLIPKKLIDSLEQYRQEPSSATEKGGVLIGLYRTPHIEVTQFTTPKPEDICKRNSFTRYSKSHIETVMHSWQNSNSKETYLGEWHTHPEKDAYPSSFDLNEWRKNLPRDRTKVLIIIGQNNNWYGVWDEGVIKSLNPLCLQG